MATKKKTSKLNFLYKKVDPTSESAALGSAFAVLFLALVKMLVIAIPLGVVIALLHHRGAKRNNGN